MSRTVSFSRSESGDVATVPTGNETRRRRLGGLARNQTILLSFAFLVMIIAFSAVNPRFLSMPAFANVLQDWGPIALMAAGQTFVIISAGIDISVGSILSLSGVGCALTIRAMTAAGSPATLTILVGVMVALMIGLTFGLINGLLITKVGLAPFIATLATMGAGAGLSLVLTGGVQVAGGPREAIIFGNTTYGGLITLPLIVATLVVIVMGIVLQLTRFGRWTFAIGSNAFAARGAGIPVTRHLIKVYVLSGLMASLAGLLVYFRLGSGSPTAGLAQELIAIAAVVIGGASLFGGAGRMSGTVLGAFIITSVLSGLILIGVEPNWQQVVVGALIAVAVAFQGFGKKA